MHFPNMLAASNGKFLNPERAVQIYEKIDDVKSKFYDYEIWELPAGATADMFSRELSGQLARSSDLSGVRRPRATLTRELLRKERGGSTNLRAERPFPRSFTRAIKLLFPYVFQDGPPELVAAETTSASSGGPFGLFNVHSAAYGQLSVRSWRPTSEGEWEKAKPCSNVGRGKPRTWD